MIKKNQHSVINNVIYCVKFAMKRQKGLILTMILAGVTMGIIPLFFSYLPKLIIDMIEKKAEIEELFVVMFFFIVFLVCVGMINDRTSKSYDWRLLHIKMEYIEERMKKAFKMDYKNLENPEVLNLMDRARYASDSYNSGMCGVYNNIIAGARNIVTIAVTIGAVAVLNPWILIVIFVLSFLTEEILKITKIINQKKYTWVMSPYWRKIAYINSFTNDFEYAKDIRIYNMQDFINQKNKEVHSQAHIISKQMFNRWIFCATGINFVGLIQNIVLYSWLIYMVLYGGMSIGNFTLYVGLIQAFYNNVTQAFDVVADMKRLSLEIDDYRAFLEYPDEEYDNSIGEKIEKVDCKEFKFVFENVSFKYPGQRDFILKNINLTIEAGERLAIVGMNGAGKTTFIKLLMRLYEPTQGRILLNGTDIRRYDKKAYYKIFAPVFQDVECFALPIKQNVSMKPMEETDDEKVEECIEKGGLSEHIMRLDEGTNTELLKIFCDNGIDLSGGEKQKLMMARALYKNADVLIFDEPTAALDALAEDRMYNQFNQIVQGNTSIYISHRLASTRFCDNIAMFMNGEIIEQGTHEELLEKREEYRKMYDVQSQYYKEEKSANE